jgi:ribosomal protein S21
MTPDEVQLEFKGLFVEVNKNFDLDKALKKLKNMLKDSGLMLEIQKHSHYTKPSAIKRDIKNRAMARERYKNANKN